MLGLGISFSLLVVIAGAFGPSRSPMAAGGSDSKASDPRAAPTGSEPSSPARAPVGEGIIRIENHAPTVDPMTASQGDPFFPSRASTNGKTLTPDMFTKPEACKECHAQIYEQWSASVMGHAWRDPIYRAILERASIATAGAVDNFCIGCHSPIGLVTGTAHALKGDVGAECSDVNCEACHTISAITGAGNAAYVLTPDTSGRPVKYGPRDDALSPFHDTTRSELHTKSEFCASCHNVTHPFNRLPVERTYDEWRDSPYNAAGVSCMSCHMTLEPGSVANPGRSAIDGKERPNVFAHTFLGANVTLQEYFDAKPAAEMTRKMLRSAATIELVNAPAALAPGGQADIQVKVTNAGAGHKLPTGFPEGREVWVDFKVCDADGNEIYRLGKIENGRTEPGTKSFKATLGDKDGNLVDIKVWEADRILSDTRILPKGWALVDFSFSIPASARGPLEIVADLKYASFPQHILDELMGKGVLEGRIVLMTSARRCVEITPDPTRAGAGAGAGVGTGGERTTAPPKRGN